MVDNSVQLIRDHCRGGLSEYTRKAYHLLPKIKNPVILDIGCGTGIQTIELAKLSGGNVLGIDIDKSSLQMLNNKSIKLNLDKNISTQCISLSSLNFPKNSFDVIWAEGSISFIGFKKGIQRWKNFLKSYGFIVIHDELKDLSIKLSHIKTSNYKLLNHFILSEQIWWDEYYEPLEKSINEFLANQKRKPDKEVRSILNEIDLYKSKPEMFSSVFFILQTMS